MPNTDPVADNAVVVEHVRRRGERGRAGRRAPGRRGHRRARAASGWPSWARWPAARPAVRMFSDDGRCVHDPLIMRRALEYATALDAVIAQHAEDHRLTAGAQAHEGVVAVPARAGRLAGRRRGDDRRPGLRAGPRGRRARCTSATSPRRGTVEVLRAAKAAGVRVTAEVTPHHLLLTDARADRLRPGAQGQPAAAHRGGHRGAAGRAGRGRDRRAWPPTTPRTPPQYKDSEWAAARPGHARPADRAVGGGAHHGRAGPAGLARGGPGAVRAAGRRSPGWPTRAGRSRWASRPTLALVDPDGAWTVRGARLASLAANTPYEGMRLPATVVATVLRGRVTARTGR